MSLHRSFEQVPFDFSLDTVISRLATRAIKLSTKITPIYPC